MKVRAPSKFTSNLHQEKSLFLGGTTGEFNWQAKVIEALRKKKGIIYNSRRGEWKKHWDREHYRQVYVDQMEWELFHMLEAECIMFNFGGGETSNEKEFLYLGYSIKLIALKIVILNFEHPKRIEIETFCDYNNVLFFHSIEEAIEHVEPFL